MKSWKIGAIAGLIAGVAAGFVALILAIISTNFLGFSHRYSYTFIIPISNIVLNEILLSMIWGFIIGIIYAKAHDLIPGKSISKGLILGLIMYLIVNIRYANFQISYAYTSYAISAIFVGFFRWIIFGILLGISYNIMCKRFFVSKDRKKISVYDMGNGIYPGAFAGIADGVGAGVSAYVGGFLGLYPTYSVTIESIFGAHIFINMMWGIVFGAFYSRFNDLIPGKGILKGLCFGIIIWLIATFQIATYFLAYGEIYEFWMWAWIGFFSTGIPFGIVLGLLYRKPTK